MPMAGKRLLRYTGAMSEHQHESPEEGARKAIGMSRFLLQHREALRALLHGNLFKPVPGSTAWRGKEWRNVAEHCVAVARGLDALGGLLGMSDEEREHMVKTGLIHDWNKRLTKNPEAFTDEERATAEAYAKQILAEHDPRGHFIDATEPRGLPRLEGDDATVAEHCVHYIDLSCLPEGIVGPEKRLHDLRTRHAGIDYDKEYPGFWDRKEALAAREEAMFLDIIRKNGHAVPPNARLCDVLKEEVEKA